MSHLDLVALLVRDYDAAMRFFVDIVNSSWSNWLRPGDIQTAAVVCLFLWL